METVISTERVHDQQDNLRYLNRVHSMSHCAARTSTDCCDERGRSAVVVGRRSSSGIADVAGKACGLLFRESLERERKLVAPHWHEQDVVRTFVDHGPAILESQSRPDCGRPFSQEIENSSHVLVNCVDEMIGSPGKVWRWFQPSTALLVTGLS